MTDKPTTQPEGGGIAAAIVVAQKALQGIGKDSQNPHHRYNYVSAEQMLTACRAALHTAGLALQRTGWTMTDPKQHSGEPHGFCVVTSHFRLSFGEEAIEGRADFPALVHKGFPLDKAVSGALTTCQSYYLRDLLLVPRVDQNEVDRRNDSNYDPSEQLAAPQRKQNPSAAADALDAAKRHAAGVKLMNTIAMWSQYESDPEIIAACGSWIAHCGGMRDESGKFPAADTTRADTMALELMNKQVSWDEAIAADAPPSDSEKRAEEELPVIQVEHFDEEPPPSQPQIDPTEMPALDYE